MILRRIIWKTRTRLLMYLSAWHWRQNAANNVAFPSVLFFQPRETERHRELFEFSAARGARKGWELVSPGHRFPARTLGKIRLKRKWKGKKKLTRHVRWALIDRLRCSRLKIIGKSIIRINRTSYKVKIPIPGYAPSRGHSRCFGLQIWIFKPSTTSNARSYTKYMHMFRVRSPGIASLLSQAVCSPSNFV